jgi:purine-nucleoside phosphorylase
MDSLAELKEWCDERRPEYAIVLGSGQVFPPSRTRATIIEIPYDKLPGFRKTSVKGHKGVLRLMELNGKAVLIFAGRTHYYEGCTYRQLVRPVELAVELGVTAIILTNSAGALNPVASVGDLVVLEDFLIPFDLGLPDCYGFEYEPMESADKDLINRLLSSGKAEGIALKMGVYGFMPGPAYETPFESRLLRNLGADVVGMSTAPEWWTALRLGLKVAGMSMVTNIHSPDAPPPSHEEVLEAASTGGEKMIRILHRTMFGVTA